MKIFIIAIALLCNLDGHSQDTVIVKNGSFTVLFDFDKYVLTEAAQARLDSFMEAEKQHLSGFYFNLDGHCDGMGNDNYNDRLSRKRVAAVKKYFLNNGMAAVNIGDETGHGKREPLNENASDEERRVNRRVEIRYMEMYPPGIPRIGTLKEQIADTAIKAGTNITLRNINFQGGMHQFLPESAPMLLELLDAMNTYPGLVIRVEGHICCEAGPGDGLDGETGELNLSAARAKAVMDYLIANSISPDRISYKGFGHSVPLYPYPEKNTEEQKQNRRVEIKIISK